MAAVDCGQARQISKKSVQELADGNLKSQGQLLDDVDSNAALASLHHANLVPVKLCKRSQVFL